LTSKIEFEDLADGDGKQVGWSVDNVVT